MPARASHIGYALYCATSPSGRMYIGLAKNFEHRRNGHYTAAKSGLDTRFARALRKYGPSMRWEIVAAGLTKAEAQIWERRLIARLRTTDRTVGYNLTAGGEGCPATPEVRAKISRSLKAAGRRPPSRKGAKMSPESRQKMREAALRRIAREGANVAHLHTPLARAKRVAARHGGRLCPAP